MEIWIDCDSLAVLIMIAAVLRNLHGDVASLRERVVKIGGEVDVLAGAVLNSARQAEQER